MSDDFLPSGLDKKIRVNRISVHRMASDCIDLSPHVGYRRLEASHRIRGKGITQLQFFNRTLIRQHVLRAA